VNLDVKANALPGVYTVSLKGVAQVPFARSGAGGAMAKGGNVPAEVIGEPILVTVIPSSLAKVTAGNLPNNTLKLGKTAEITVKVERQYDFAGEFTVKFELPKGVTGVSAEEVTIPAGKDEVKLVLTADDDAKPGAVTVTAARLPKGVTAKPLTIGPGARWGVLVLNAAPDAAAFTGAITL
jgi:hypothetical protein